MTGFLAAGTRAEAGERPNVLFIMTDDQAAWAVGAARGAHPQVRTPHIDRIYREGAYLPNAFTPTPVCSPSRAALMTGRYGSELGITDWIHPNEKGLGLDDKLPTWPRALRQAGYATGLMGKWHLGEAETQWPVRFGYDHFSGFLGGGIRLTDPMLVKNGQPARAKGFTPDVITDEALAFLRAQQKDGAPFLLSVHFREPHAPWLPLPDEDWLPFKELAPKLPEPRHPDLNVAEAERVTREYLASVAAVDRSVGRLLAALDELGLDGNTVVVFTSDHGYNLGHNGIWHKGNGHWLVNDPPPATDNIPRGQRPNLFDHSIRIPLAIRWPGVIKPGTVVTETVTMLDWFPTVLAIAGVELPEAQFGRGRNLLPLLKGERIEGWHNDLFVQYSTKHESRTHMRAYRTPEWKLVRDFLDPSRDELYHLAKDPEETANLIASKDAETARAREDLHGKLAARMREINDPALH